MDGSCCEARECKQRRIYCCVSALQRVHVWKKTRPGFSSLFFEGNTVYFIARIKWHATEYITNSGKWKKVTQIIFPMLTSCAARVCAALLHCYMTVPPWTHIKIYSPKNGTFSCSFISWNRALIILKLLEMRCFNITSLFRAYERYPTDIAKRDTAKGVCSKLQTDFAIKILSDREDPTYLYRTACRYIKPKNKIYTSKRECDTLGFYTYASTIYKF
jgi:hypothetical protein